MRLGDLDHLLLGHAERVDQPLGIDRRADARRAAPRRAARRARQSTRRHGAAAFERQRDVLGHGEMRETARAAGRWPRCPARAPARASCAATGAAVDLDRAGVRAHGAGDDLDRACSCRRRSRRPARGLRPHAGRTTRRRAPAHPRRPWMIPVAAGWQWPAWCGGCYRTAGTRHVPFAHCETAPAINAAVSRSSAAAR